MLTLDQEREYIVYPSWADLPYKWETLPGRLMPLKRYRTEEDDEERTAPKVQFLDGPAGGGVIVVDKLPDERWPDGFLLVSHANRRVPNGRALVPSDPFGSLVTYLEPYENPPEVQVGLRPKPKLYVCGATPEHAASAGDAVYWLASLEKRLRRAAKLAELPRWASAFGVEVTEIATMPEQLRAETAGWFNEPSDFDNVWFQVSGVGSSAGFQFAVVVYIALHARSVVKHLRAMHLVADIEGRGCFRKTWHRR